MSRMLPMLSSGYAIAARAYISNIRLIDSGEWIWKDASEYARATSSVLKVAFNADSAADMDRVRAELNSVPYSVADLKKDLREITEVFRAARR